MKADSRFLNQPMKFWANVRLISQLAHYTDKKTKMIKVPSIDEIVLALKKDGIDATHIRNGDTITPFGKLIHDYFQHRAIALQNCAEPNLMRTEAAKHLYDQLYQEIKPASSQPMNKQKRAMQAPAYFTCIVNMLIELSSRGYECDYDPQRLSGFTTENRPFRTLSRRVDGSFPKGLDPIAVWEIKEYYYTTTFGSRIADGVYESMLDGFELKEVRESTGRAIGHYLMIDAYDTWWGNGKSYLCRICDMIHMGYLSEALFGREIVTRIPELVAEWIAQLKKQNH